MKLLRFEADNIFSLGTVELDLEKRGLLLVTGYSEDEGHSNGAGKSSLASKGILWTLFGQIPDDMKADEVVNRHSNKKSGFGELTFLDSKDRRCVVKRERGKKNALKFFIGNKDLSRRNQKDTQELINQTIGRDYDTFIQSDFFGQGREMSYASLTPKQQKEILEQILPIEECDKWAEYAKEQYKALDERVSEKEREVHTAAIKLQTLKSQYETTLGHDKHWEESNKNKIKELEHKLEQEEKRIEEVKQQITNLKLNANNYPVLSKKEVENLEADRETMKSEVTEYNDKNTEAFTRFNQWSMVLSQYKNDIARLETKLGKDICPSCDRSITEEMKAKIKGELKHINMLAAEAEANLKQAQDASAYWADKCGQINDSLAHIESVFNSSNRNYHRRYEIELQIQKKTEELGPVYHVLKDKLEGLQKEKNPFKSQLEVLNREIKNRAKEEKELKAQLKVLEREREDLLFWHNMYGKDLKLRLFEAACPFLDARVAYHLSALSNDQIHVEFSTVKRLANGEAKEEFSVNAWSDTGGASFGSLSGGEKKITSFAIGLALADLAESQVAGSTDFLILDEPFEQLDDLNSEAIVHYLKDVCDKSTVLLVSNEEHLKQLIPNRIHVVKRAGISTIEGT